MAITIQQLHNFIWEENDWLIEGEDGKVYIYMYIDDAGNLTTDTTDSEMFRTCLHGDYFDEQRFDRNDEYFKLNNPDWEDALTTLINQADF